MKQHLLLFLFCLPMASCQTENIEDLIPEIDNLVGEWIHSAEEDLRDTIVYRTDEFNFPLDYFGRQSMEFFADGRVTLQLIAPEDGFRTVDGNWTKSEEDLVSIRADDSFFWEFQIVLLSSEQLQIFTVE